MSSLTPDNVIDPQSSTDNESIEAFVATFELTRLLSEAARPCPIWLFVAADARDRDAFALLVSQLPNGVVVAPLQQLTPETTASLGETISRYPQRYTARLRETLTVHREQLAGIIVSRDLAPWVRHLVRACKTVDIRTVLIPSEPIARSHGSALRDHSHIGSRWKRDFWNVPSCYSDPDVVTDAPITDTVIAFGASERAAVVALGYPEGHVQRVHPTKSLTRLHRSTGFWGKDAFSKLHTMRTKSTVRYLVERLRALETESAQGYDPSNLDVLFSGTIEPMPRAGLVGYHRAIDESSTYVPAMLGYRRLLVPSTIEDAQAVDVFACWGGSQGEHRKRRLKRWAKRLNRPLLLLEDGLFRSVEIGLSGSPTVSIMLDDRGTYYDATRSNRLEKLLASKHHFTSQERGRSNRCIRRIVEYRLSKYNHAPDRPLPFPLDSVLVVDQRKGDLSVSKGLASESSFREMLLCARRENPDRTILIKRHPDALSGGKQAYFSDEALAQLGELPNVQLIDYETNPHALFDCCKEVYVVTSGMGFEALMRGLRVHCFGMPFYAGWGLTIDQLTVPRRKRKRSLAELFYATCILHSRYYDPLTQCPCTLEEVITYLKTARDEQQVPSKKSRA